MNMGIDRDEAKLLAEKAAALAFQYEGEYGGCGQCVLGALKDSLGSMSDEVFRAGSAFAGGVALLGHNCGAFLAWTMVFGVKTGREYSNFADPERTRDRAYELTRQLYERFQEEYGSIECREIQEKIMGRFYDLRDPEEKAAFLEAGGHSDKCTNVCANAARWTVELLAGRD